MPNFLKKLVNLDQNSTQGAGGLSPPFMIITLTSSETLRDVAVHWQLLLIATHILTMNRNVPLGMNSPQIIIIYAQTGYQMWGI